MFLIGPSARDGARLAPLDEGLGSEEMALLSQFCLVERWSASLHSAVLRMGARAAALHGLDPAAGRFGLLEFVRCYDPRVHHEIIGLFEKAAEHRRPFHYCAQLHAHGAGQPVVHCYGDFQSDGDDADGQMFGIFLFSRAQFSEN